jgi:hypothetical protein
MNCEIVKVERVQLGRLPRGVYVGDWSGYHVKIPLQTEDWILHTKDSIRGTAPVLITVADNGEMTVEIDNAKAER